MTPTISQKSLADRLTEGRLPVGEALRCAMQLADALRRLHDSGRVYGAVTPSNILLTGAGAELAADPEQAGGITPYTAPEVLQGKPVDSRSEIFSFGAILFEMLTGHRAFDGDDESSLAAALTGSAPPSSGSPLVDRLVANCVAKDPTVRCQRMQKVIMELKLLSVAARRAEAPASKRAQTETQLRAEIQQLEDRLAARIASQEQDMARMHEGHLDALAQIQEAHQRSLAEAQESAGEAVNAMRGQLAEVTVRLAEAQEHMAQPSAEVSALADQLVERVNQAVAPLGQRVGDIEEALQDLRNHINASQENFAVDLEGISETLRSQDAAIDSARTAMAQTDDLVERVVEALELLQASVLDQHDEHADAID